MAVASKTGLVACRSFDVSLKRAFLAVARLAGSRSVSGFSSSTISESSSDFERWHNGGGFFHKLASIDATAVIEIGAIVHPKSVIGANAHLQSGAVVGPSVIIGHSTRIGYNAVLANCFVGDACIIHNSVCIGQDGVRSLRRLRLRCWLKLDEARSGKCACQRGWQFCLRNAKKFTGSFDPLRGFGFLVDEEGNVVKKPQMLYVKIGNHVEIGANTCIDRGSWRDTVVGNHTKIDNLVQIGHNVVIGNCCMICGQVGIAGSVTMGDYVTLGGKVAVRDHISIVSKVRLAACSCVTKDLTLPGDYGGFPAIPIHEWRRQVASGRRNSQVPSS